MDRKADRRWSWSWMGLALGLAFTGCGESTTEPPGPVPCGAATTVGSISVETSRDGNLGTGDCLFDGGRFAEGWRFELGSPMFLEIGLGSPSFDAFLLVTDRQMNVVAFDDDGGLGLDSRLVQSFAPGSYIVWVTSFTAGETGPYRLSVESAGIACSSPVGNVAVGTTVGGSLAETDCRLEGGALADPWRLALDEAADLRIDLRSPEFDTFLYVTDPFGSVIALDDDGGEGLDSRLELELAAGEYRVVASSFLAGETGAYALTVASVPSAGALRAGSRHATILPAVTLSELLGSDKGRLSELGAESGPGTPGSEKR